MAELTEVAAVRRATDRLGFGLGGSALAQAQQAGLTATLATYLAPAVPDPGAAATPPPDLADLPRPGARVQGQQPDPAEKKRRRQARNGQVDQLTLWWLERMVRADRQLSELLTWVWHGHFATSVQKVKDPALMLGQNQTLRRLGRGRFDELARAMVVDRAMLVWLDGSDNTAQAPNENLAREFLELFALGHGHYGEDDIREAARALTGWRLVRPTGRAVLRPRLHDAGPKQLFGVPADYDANGLVEVTLRQPASADFVASRLWFRLVSITPPALPTLARLTAAYGPDHDLDALLRALVADPGFRDDQSTLVKQPVEWLVGLMRAVGVAPSTLPAKRRRRLLALLRGMGQVPFRPPSVGGWPAGGAWLTGAAALSRLAAARLVVGAVRVDAEARRTPREGRPELVRRWLGVDAFTPRTAAALDDVGGVPAALVVGACSPEYLVSR